MYKLKDSCPNPHHPLMSNLGLSQTLHEKCPYSEFFWSLFSRIQTKYGEILRIFPYSVRMRGNKDQKNSKYGHFSRIDIYCMKIRFTWWKPLNRIDRHVQLKSIIFFQTIKLRLMQLVLKVSPYTHVLHI